MLPESCCNGSGNLLKTTFSLYKRSTSHVKSSETNLGCAERGKELHVATYCFRAPYVASLLRQGLAVSDADVHIGSGNVAWTLGGRSGCACADNSQTGRQHPCQHLVSTPLAPLSAPC